MSNDLYQKIYNEISGLLPLEWKKIIFYGENGNDSYLYEFFIVDLDGKTIKCFDLPEIDNIAMALAFSNINAAVTTEKSEISKDKQWDIITLIIDNLGNFSAEYQFKEMNYDEYEQHAIWKYRFLGEIPDEENTISYNAVKKFLQEEESKKQVQ